ncbi:alpha/beta fold hydrolase [uncultured Traorella sp.]|uniref:alpha/beta hydrolase n=1 Tax=uncultured Traorella sp. TaxID=1929048 RepID=UPI0025DFF986|nr:alpha/beta fold hydrolase [uncultured Traorella sp.]
MLENLKKLFHKNDDKVLITIHGFGVNRKHEMDDFIQYATASKIEIISFNMFDIHDEDDDDYNKWILVAENKLQQAFDQNKKVYLLGFSMGGVIASYLAGKYPVEKLILISPAFIHFNIENYAGIAIKTGKKLLSGSDENKPSMPRSFYSAFMGCVKEHKNDIRKVSCPILLIQGDADEVIPTRSSEWAYEQISHDQKKCIFLHGGKHRLLQDKSVQDVAFLLIDDFLQDKLLPLKK